MEEQNSSSLKKNQEEKYWIHIYKLHLVKVDDVSLMASPQLTLYRGLKMKVRTNRTVLILERLALCN